MNNAFGVPICLWDVFCFVSVTLRVDVFTEEEEKRNELKDKISRRGVGVVNFALAVWKTHVRGNHLPWHARKSLRCFFIIVVQRLILLDASGTRKRKMVLHNLTIILECWRFARLQVFLFTISHF